MGREAFLVFYFSRLFQDACMHSIIPILLLLTIYHQLWKGDLYNTLKASLGWGRGDKVKDI